jgi:hypothetical protein
MAWGARHAWTQAIVYGAAEVILVLGLGEPAGLAGGLAGRLCSQTPNSNIGAGGYVGQDEIT